MLLTLRCGYPACHAPQKGTDHSKRMRKQLADKRVVNRKYHWQGGTKTVRMLMTRTSCDSCALSRPNVCNEAFLRIMVGMFRLTRSRDDSILYLRCLLMPQTRRFTQLYRSREGCESCDESAQQHDRIGRHAGGGDWKTEDNRPKLHTNMQRFWAPCL